MLSLKIKNLSGNDLYYIDFTCAGNLLFIHYSLFIIHILFPGFEPTSFRFEMKKKM